MEYQSELKRMYEMLGSNALVNSLTGIAIFLALIFISKRIYRAYKGQEEKGWKVFFDVAKEYLLITLFIAIFPFFLHYLELVLGGVQEYVSSNFNASVEMSADAYIAKSIGEYIDESANEDKGALDSIFAFSILDIADTLLGITLSTFLLQINKYLYFFFCAGRYLWLLMLEIVSPVAIVCVLDDKTSDIFKAWLKNMFLCYMLIPFFLLADLAGELAIKILASTSLLFAYNTYGLLAILGTLILKISLYKLAANRTFKLLD